MLVLAQAQQASTDQRAASEVEGRVGFLFGMTLDLGLRILRVA